MSTTQTQNNLQHQPSTVRTEAHLTHPKYRPDIDGLRAIAVLSVVGFHAFPFWVKGGLVGVDIFFVISGFLISTIIFGSLERNAFSFAEFYGRRIRRIFPALLIVLIASYAFGWFVLLSGDFKQLGKHIAAGAVFVSNFVLWNESGYFDNAAQTKPLLHLWSLGIEEQFYIVWPLLLWAAWRKRFNLLTITLLLALISFALNIDGIRKDAIGSFYSPQTRFWELLAGSLLAWFSLYKKSAFAKQKYKLDYWLGVAVYAHAQDANGKTLQNAQSIVGLLLIAIALLTITKDSSFPGWWAILPALGSVLIISAGSNTWINRSILSNRVLVWFGLISYPLYLWHWPLLSFARIIEGGVPSREIRIAAVTISIALAWLTYQFIEKRIRAGQFAKTVTFLLVALLCMVGSVGYYTQLNEGLPGRAPATKVENYTKSLARANGRESECFNILYAYKKPTDWYCTLGSPSNESHIFAYGDSHAMSLIPAIERFANSHKTSIPFSANPGCPPLLGIQALRGEAEIEKHNCQEFNNRIYEYVKNNHIETVLLVARWTYYTGGKTMPDDLSQIALDRTYSATKENSIAAFVYGLKNKIEKKKSIGVRVIIVEDNPQQKIGAADALRKSGGLNDAAINTYSILRSEHDADQEYVRQEIRKLKRPSVTIVNFDDLLCNKLSCPLAVDNQFLYFDDNHLSNTGANIVYPIVAKALETPRYKNGL